MIRSVWAQAILLAGLVVVLYSNSLKGSFHYDDFHSIVDNPNIRQLENIPTFFVDPTLFSQDPQKAMYRPLLLVSYALNYAVGQYRVEGYHLVNIGLHLACTLLVWSLGSRAGLGRQGRLAAALLFAVHPLASEPVNYLTVVRKACLLYSSY